MEKIITTRASRKQLKERYQLELNIATALSKFTAILMGEPDNYKSKDGYINYYPSDCLNYWRYSTINKDGQIINNPTPKEAAGIICEGRRYCHDESQQITVMFNDI